MCDELIAAFSKLESHCIRTVDRIHSIPKSTRSDSVQSDGSANPAMSHSECPSVPDSLSVPSTVSSDDCIPRDLLTSSSVSPPPSDSRSVPPTTTDTAPTNSVSSASVNSNGLSRKRRRDKGASAANHEFSGFSFDRSPPRKRARTESNRGIFDS